MIGLAYICLLLVVAVAAPVIAPHNPVRSGKVQQTGIYRQAAWVEDPNPLKTGRWTYPLGTDSIGRDVFSRLVYGSRTALLVGFVPMVVVLLIGVPIGLTAGYARGWRDGVLMRLTDVIYAFPALLFFIVIQVALRETRFGNLLNGLVLLFATLSVVSWTSVARLVRGETLVVREREFVAAACAAGAGTRHIVVHHVLPNVLGPVLVAAAFLVPAAIIAEAILSYLGIGVQPAVRLDTPFPTSWGNMLLEGYRGWQAQAWTLIGPSLAVALTTVAFTVVGDGLRDALDPHATP